MRIFVYNSKVRMYRHGFVKIHVFILKSTIPSWQTFDFVGKVLKSPDKVRKKLAKFSKKLAKFLTAYQLVDIIKAKR